MQSLVPINLYITEVVKCTVMMAIYNQFQGSVNYSQCMSNKIQRILYVTKPYVTTSFHVLSMLSKVPAVLSYSAHTLGTGGLGTAWTKPVKRAAIISKHTIISSLRIL